MRKLGVLGVVAAVMAALTVGTGTAFASGSCTNVQADTPMLNSGVVAGASGSCTVKVTVDIVPQYESGGTWHRATKGGANVLHVAGPFPAGGWSFGWTFQALDQTPYCAYNWRMSVGVFNDATSDGLASLLSPELHKSC